MKPAIPGTINAIYNLCTVPGTRVPGTLTTVPGITILTLLYILRVGIGLSFVYEIHET
jgi:hypothetical protein